MATQSSDSITAPAAMPEASKRHEDFTKTLKVSSGLASEYWLELVQYPPGSARSLWLYVDGSWRHLDNPNRGTEDSVQEAFCQCPDRLEVAVWYSGDVIVGLVTRSK